MEQDNELVVRNCAATCSARSYEILNSGFANCLPIGVGRSACFLPRVKNDLHIGSRGRSLSERVQHGSLLKFISANAKAPIGTIGSVDEIEHCSKEAAREPLERRTIRDLRWAAIAKFPDIGLRTGNTAVEVNRVLPLILLLRGNAYLDRFRCAQRPRLAPHCYDPVGVLVTVTCREIAPEKSLDRMVLGRNHAIFDRHVGKHLERTQP